MTHYFAGAIIIGVPFVLGLLTAKAFNAWFKRRQRGIR